MYLLAVNDAEAEICGRPRAVEPNVGVPLYAVLFVSYVFTQASPYTTKLKYVKTNK